jgi:hypothetical protein
MPSPSLKIIQLLSVFAISFTALTWAKALVLLYGTILAPGRWTVTAALRALGLASLAGYEYLQDLNLGPHPLGKDQAVQDAWDVQFRHIRRLVVSCMIWTSRTLRGYRLNWRPLCSHTSAAPHTRCFATESM